MLPVARRQSVAGAKEEGAADRRAYPLENLQTLPGITHAGIVVYHQQQDGHTANQLRFLNA